ncbi:MAG TPA: hypothetical protein VG758_04940 [Hyphomicrobiaceae bacterium]|nr:hypothetical protein [Hyphomicrobiaceae bacterium]
MGVFSARIMPFAGYHFGGVSQAIRMILIAAFVIAVSRRGRRGRLLTRAETAEEKLARCK